MSLRLLLISLALTCSQQAFATTFISGGVAAGTNATIGTASDPSSSSNTLIAPGVAAASSSSYVVDGTTFASTYAGAVANWNSADTGTFDLNWGWESTTSGINTTLQTNQVPTNWFYTFTASGNGVFNVLGSVIGTGYLFGLQPVYFNGNTDQIGGTVSDPNGSGSLAFALLNGQTYTFSAFNYGNLTSPGGLNFKSDASGTFSWDIKYSAVPIPAALPLLASGIAAFGAMGARRRAKRNLAA